MSEQETFVVLTYGPSGIGKTTDQGYSFPNALFLAAPGSLSSIVSTCGYTPKSVHVATIMEATELIESLGQTDKFDTVVIDDFSFMAEQTFSRLENSGKYKGFALWGKMRDVALDFRDKSRYAGINVVLNAWEQAPKRKENGSLVRGGPQLSGKLPEQIPALCDVVLRAVQEPRSKPWPTVYRCTPDPSFVMKDRFNVVSVCDPCPMNLGEILRASGRNVSRHSMVDEEKVETISQSLTGDLKNDGPLLNDVFSSLLASDLPSVFARWTVRDAFDRAIIRRDLQKHATNFIDLGSGSLLG